MATLDELDEPLLRRLYLDEGMTEAEIAQRYDTYQVKVGRLRRSYGIPTLARSGRLGLPEALTLRLRSVLIGSMLGNGALRRTGPQTAGYVEHHSVRHEAYFDWKVREWGPLVTRPPSSGDSHRLITHGCRALFPFWQMFYPEGTGAKTFTRLPLEWVDELAVAVWFMDDAKATDFFWFTGNPRDADRRVQRKALLRFVIRTKPHNEDGDLALRVLGSTYTQRLIDVVQPHVHPSMAHKLELEPEKNVTTPKDLLTPQRLQPFVERGFPARAIAEVLKVSRSSVRRALGRMGAPRRPCGRPSRGSRKELAVESAKLAIERLDAGAESYADDVLAVLCQTSIPLPTHSARRLVRDVELIREASTKVEGDTLVHPVIAGSLLCVHLFSHRWDARYRRHPSPREAWYDPKHLGKAIRFQLTVGDPLTPKRVFRAIQAVVRAPTNFRPCYAKALAETFCPEGGLVLDPCAGYGGRATGVLAAGRRYVGVEPHPGAPEAFRGLSEALGGHLELHPYPFEDVDLGNLQADMVLTSPPYFCVEQYADDPKQSWVRYPSWDGWVEGFLRALVSKSRAHLKPGGCFCVNTKDVRLRGHEYPIAQELIRLAGEAGFELERTLSLPLGRVGRESHFEPLFVFR